MINIKKYNKLCLLLTLYVDDIVITRVIKNLPKLLQKIKYKIYKVSTDKNNKQNLWNEIINKTSKDNKFNQKDYIEKNVN